MSEPVEQGEPIDVRLEGAMTDGVFKIDAGIEDTALITIQYGQHGYGFIPTLLHLLGEKFPGIHTAILEAIEADEGTEEEK